MTNDAGRQTVKNPTQRSHATTSTFNFFNHNDLLWWPYRSLSTALLQTHHNTVAFVQINRKLRDELNDIGRRHQDFVLDLSERLLNTTSQGGDSARKNTAEQPNAMNELYATAVSGMREFGQAVASAHVRSVEALWQHAVKANAADDSLPRAQAAE